MTLDSSQTNAARRAISRRVVGLLKEYVGRGPTSARTMISDDLIVIVLGDTLTRGEKVLAGEDEVGLVREMRRTFQRTMEQQLHAVVEEETGRTVRSLFGDHSVLPDYAFTACLLDPLDDENGSPNGDPALREHQREISRGMVGLYKELLGRGPKQARTYVEDDVVVSLLGDTLTRAEQTLADEERPASITEMRRQLQSALAERACRIVSEATGREVLAFMSDHSVYPDYALEVFLLADGEHDDSVEEATAVGEA